MIRPLMPGRNPQGLATVLACLVFVVAACSPSATPSPSASAAETASSAPAASAPASASSSPAAGGAGPVAGRFCEGMKITFFPGGTPGGGFETVVYNGAKAAEAAFGPTVAYQWSDWDPNKMITQFQEAVATKPGRHRDHGSPRRRGIQAARRRRGIEGDPGHRDEHRAPQLQATYAARRLRLCRRRSLRRRCGAGQRGHGAGQTQVGRQGVRLGTEGTGGPRGAHLGITETLEKAGLNVVYLEIDDATNADPVAGVPAFTGMASANPDLKAIFIDHGNLTSTIPTYLQAANLSPDAIYAAGFDLSASTVQGIKDGQIDLVIDQQQFLQGFFAIAQLCLAKFYGFSGLHINTGGGFVDKSNVDVIAPLVEQQIR